MIRITYIDHGDSFWMEAAGHAGYAEYGHDVVCASVTALVKALALRIEEVSGRRQYVTDGIAKIHGSGTEAMEASRTVMCGLRYVHDAAPDLVSIDEDCL